MSDPTTTPGRIGGAELRKLRGRAQRLEAVTRLGKGGLSPEFLAGLDRELALHELVKVRLYELKDQRHEVGEQLAQKTGSHLVTVIGHVVVLYRPKPAAVAGTAA
jgi:RNA-binding protein